MVRIAAKHSDDPLKEEFETWMADNNTNGRKPVLFHLLMSRFREMKESVEFDRIKKRISVQQRMHGYD